MSAERSEERASPPLNPTPTPADAKPAAAEEFFCDLCGAEMLNVHCKLSCPRCGYKRDCSDP